MNKNCVLEPGETLRWEARPAPRCYTFRHWPHSIFGLFFFIVCICWLLLGQSTAKTYALPWLGWLPFPFVLIGLYFFVGHLVQARIEWNHVYYAITDRRLIAQRGLLSPRTESLELSEITYFRLHRVSEQLGTLRVHKGAQSLVLHCIEYPRQATDLLEEAMEDHAMRRAE